MPKLRDLTGQKFGRLTVIERQGSKNGHAAWLCKCECGKEKIIIGSNLTTGKIQSCGCYRTELNVAWGKSTALDLTGKNFGELFVLERAYEKEVGKKNGGRPMWKCQCSCGNITYVRSGNLINGSTKSCGHVFSFGNQKINKILQENNIIFQKEYQIKYNNHFYRYDFALLNKNKNIIGLIEYDGQQHFYFTNQGWNTQETLNKTIMHDKIKNKWAEENKIPLIRIPYTEFDNLNIEFLKKLFYQYNIPFEKI